MPRPRLLATRLILAGSAAALLAAGLPAHARPPAASPVSAEAASYAGRADVRDFARQMAERHGLDAHWVRTQLAQAHYLPRVARLMAPPPATGAAKKNWAAYRDRFVEPVRIDAGVAFWNDNEPWLELAEQRFGVPAYIVVGILGVETLYGRHTGNFRVLDALATLAFDYPEGARDRSDYFRQELENYFVMCAGDDLDPQAVLGSYAGAIGLPQFMPGSVNRYAVDLDGDGHIDLHDSAADAIGSVARFLAAHGWQPGLPVRLPVTPPADAGHLATLLEPDIVPMFSPDEFAAHGAALDAAAQALPGKLALVELENGDAPPSYTAGTSNFYALTRYNRSSYYAMAVIDLGQTIADVRRYTR